MNRWPALLFASLLGIALACGLDDELENADCLSNADCWTNQDCVRTMTQAEMQLPGLCRPQGSGCAKGEQLGCACENDQAGTYFCPGTDVTLYPSSSDANCMCLAEPPDGTSST